MKQNCIYILTNPSFPEFVKIGYADDVEKRLKDLNRTECTPFAFRLYATYDVDTRLSDLKIHSIIEKLNPSLRSIDNVNGKKRVREFFAMSARTAYELFEAIAEIHGTQSKLHLYEADANQIKEEEEAEVVRSKRKLPRMDWMIEQELVKIGDEIHVINYPNEIATLVDGRTCKYKDRIMSFNEFGCEVTGWSAIRTYTFMKIVGQDETLSELRKKRLLELEE